MEQRLFVAGTDDDGRRLDRVARRLFPGAPLGRIFRAIRTGAVLLNGHRASPSARVGAGDQISAAGLAPFGDQPPRPLPAPAETPLAPLAPLVLLENDHVLAINKPEGMAVHGPDSAELLVTAHLQGKRPSLSFRPGPAHRLDRGTSGLLLFSCSLQGAQTLTRLFRERRVTKEYLAVVEGVVAREETWQDSIDYDHESRRAEAGDLAAITRVAPLASGGGHTLLACFPLTGRTHQIRAQAALHGHPLAGDTRYGGRAAGGYLLHALSISVGEAAPVLGFERLVAPQPRRFADAVADLFGEQTVRAVLAEAQCPGGGSPSDLG